MSEIPSNECIANRAPRYASRGFNLIEMITVMSIAAILLAIAIPSYQYVTNANRIAAEGNGLLGDLQFARAEAIKQGQPISVCVSTDAATCAAGNTAWQSGWIVFTDVNGNGTVEAGETVLRVQPAFSGTDTFLANNNVAGVTFNREGFAAVPNGTLITLHSTPEVTSYTRCLSLGIVGLMAIQPYGGTCT